MADFFDDDEISDAGEDEGGLSPVGEGGLSGEDEPMDDDGGLSGEEGEADGGEVQFARKRPREDFADSDDDDADAEPEPPEWDETLFIDAEDQERLEEMPEVQRMKELNARQHAWDDYKLRCEAREKVPRPAKVPKKDIFDEEDEQEEATGEDAQDAAMLADADAAADADLDLAGPSDAASESAQREKFEAEFEDDDDAEEAVVDDDALVADPSTPTGSIVESSTAREVAVPDIFGDIGLTADDFEEHIAKEDHLPPDWRGLEKDERDRKLTDLLSQLVLTRSKVESLFNLPEAEFQRALKGCYVRLNLPVEATDEGEKRTKVVIVEIISVEHTDEPYPCGNRRMNHQLLVERRRNNKASRKEILIDILSDRLPERAQLLQEIEEWQKTQGDRELLALALEKLEHLNNSTQFKFTEEMVARILHDKGGEDALKSLAKKEAEARARVVEIHSQLEITNEEEQRRWLLEELKKADENMDNVRLESHFAKVKFERDNLSTFGMTNIMRMNAERQAQLDRETNPHLKKGLSQGWDDDNPFRRNECMPRKLWDMGETSRSAPEVPESPAASQGPGGSAAGEDGAASVQSMLQQPKHKQITSEMQEAHKRLNLLHKIDLSKLHNAMSKRAPAKKPMLMRKDFQQQDWQLEKDPQKVLDWKDYLRNANGLGF